MATSDQRTLLQLIAESGRAGRDQWTAQQQTQRQTAADAIARLLGGSSGKGPSSFQTYPQQQQQVAAQVPWAASLQAPRQPSYGKGSYGPTAKGAYSGYKTASDLKAAVEGVATMRQQEGQAAAQAAFQRLLDEFDTYDKGQQAAAEQAATHSTQAMDRFNTFNMGRGRRVVGSERAADYRMNGPAYSTPDRGPNVASYDSGAAAPGWASVMEGVNQSLGRPNAPAAAPPVTHGPWKPILNGDEEQAQAEAANRDYALRQEQGTADDWQKYLADLTAKQQPNIDAIQAVGDRTIGDYSREVAQQDFGISPELATGFFNPLKDRADMSQARDLQSWQDLGMPFGEAQRSQTADEKAALEAQDAGMNDAIYGATGFGGSQLASAVGLSPTDLYDVLSSPEYGQAYDAIVAAAQNNDAPAAEEAMRQASADPRIARILEKTVGTYIPKGYDYYSDAG